MRGDTTWKPSRTTNGNFLLDGELWDYKVYLPNSRNYDSLIEWCKEEGEGGREREEKEMYKNNPNSPYTLQAINWFQISYGKHTRYLNTKEQTITQIEWAPSIKGSVMSKY